MSESKTFIDEALASSSSGEGFVQAMVDIYSHPEVRTVLTNYPDWIVNIITVIDYDTELQMEGLDFRSYEKEINALRSMGIDSEADILASLTIDSTNEEANRCYDNLALNNDYDSFWAAVYEYAEKNLMNR